MSLMTAAWYSVQLRGAQDGNVGSTEGLVSVGDAAADGVVASLLW
jgi:hypothetical protein